MSGEPPESDAAPQDANPKSVAAPQDANPKSKNSAPGPVIRSARPDTLILALVAAVGVGAFLGGYVIGTGDESTSNEELAIMISQVREAQSRTNQPQVPTIRAVSADDDPVLGDPAAPVTIIEFSDFQCPFCGRFHQMTLPQLEREYISTGKANLVYRDLPLDTHPNAVPVHVAAECADEQGAFWEYHDILFERQGEWSRKGPVELNEQIVAYGAELGLSSSFEECLSSPDIKNEVASDRRDAAAYGASGTPTFFVGNDETGYVRIAGAQPFDTFKAIIDAKLG